jgi:signal transduction histidine kinase
MNKGEPSSPGGDTVSRALYEQLQRRYERLMAISRQLNSTLDLGALLRRILDAARELTDTEEASILLVDPATGELRFEAASNLSRAEMEAIPVPMQGSLAGWVATHGEPVLVRDARRDARWFPRVDKTTRFVTRNLLAVPMQVHGRTIGVLEAINKRGDQPWTDDDREVLAALGDQAAIAVQNARLFQQNDFIADIVHELRTPLAALKAGAALLVRPQVSEDVRQEVARTILTEVDRLTELTTDFLDLARLESGRMRLEPVSFDLRELVTECLGTVTPAAAERGISLNVRPGTGTVYADRDRIKQVLLNLLTNAIKYNVPGGSVTVSFDVRRSPGDEEQEQFVVSVADTGPGISPDDAPHIFERFYRAGSADQTSGTGLGLTIARRLVEAHGGEMWFESVPGAGTTFYFTLPVEPPCSS